MSDRTQLITFHIMGTVAGKPVFIHIRERYVKDALQAASRTATNLIVLFATAEEHSI